MTALLHTPHLPHRAVWLALLGLVATSAFAQQVTNPGDIIVERDITPRIAYRSVPLDQDPVLVRATTFPANTFDPMMANVVSDLELTNAYGSSGIAPNGVASGNAGLAAVSQILTGSMPGGSINGGPGAMATPSGGIGGMISSSVTGALIPVASALGALK